MPSSARTPTAQRDAVLTRRQGVALAISRFAQLDGPVMPEDILRILRNFAATPVDFQALDERPREYTHPEDDQPCWFWHQHLRGLRGQPWWNTDLLVVDDSEA